MLCEFLLHLKYLSTLLSRLQANKQDKRQPQNSQGLHGQFRGESVEIYTPDFVEENNALSCPDCAFTCKTTQGMSSHRNFKHGKYQNRR